MSGIIFVSIPAILETCTTLQARIAMLDTILNGMEAALLRATATGMFEGYKIDTGQTKNEIMYRSIGELNKAYMDLLKTQQALYARLNLNRQGGVQRLMDGSNFT